MQATAGPLIDVRFPTRLLTQNSTEHHRLISSLRLLGSHGRSELLRGGATTAYVDLQSLPPAQLNAVSGQWV